MLIAPWCPGFGDPGESSDERAWFGKKEKGWKEEHLAITLVKELEISAPPTRRSLFVQGRSSVAGPGAAGMTEAWYCFFLKLAIF